MINSLRDIINESVDGLVDEMGIKKPERLAQSHIGRQRQQTVDRQRTLANRPVTRTFEEVSVDLLRLMKALPSSDIVMEQRPNERQYFPKLPQPIVTLMNELKSIDQSRFTREFGKWRDIYPTDNNSILMKTDGSDSYQRSHFPNDGIPSNLRGIGLGYKLYRALVRKVGYISSNSGGSTEKDKAWGSLLSYKANPDGSPSIDDAHAIIGSGSWMVLDKGISNSNKITIAERFIQNIIGYQYTTPDRFDIDDELLAILPDEFLVKLDSNYLNSLKIDDRLTRERYEAILASASASQQRDAERMEREATERRERLAREEASTRERLAARITQFGADPDAEWNVGDFIVVKQYLYDSGYTSLPIRRVVALVNGSYYAINIKYCERLDRGEPILGQIGVDDTRITSDKSTWIKINLEAIPDLDRVNLTPAEKQYVLSLITPEERQHREEETNIANATRIEQDTIQNVERAQDRTVFGAIPESPSEMMQFLTRRPLLASIHILKKLRTGNFVKFIVLDTSQRDGLRNPFGVPVYAAIKRSNRYQSRSNRYQTIHEPEDLVGNDISPYVELINVLTGHIIHPPFSGLGLTAYKLAPVSEVDKLQVRGGDHYYIANHMNKWGIFAKASYTTRNTIDQPFIYLRVGTGLCSVRLDLLRKVVGEPYAI